MGIRDTFSFWNLAMNPVLFLIIIAACCCTCCALWTQKKVFLIIGLYIISSVLTQYIVGNITMFIGVKHALYLIVLWALTVIVMQIDFFIECYTFGLQDLKIGAINALGGSIAASVAMLVIDIVTKVIPVTKAVRSVLEMLPIIGHAAASMIDAQILTIFNLIFGMAVARNIALAQACPAPTPTTTPPGTTNAPATTAPATPAPATTTAPTAPTAPAPATTTAK